MRKTGAFTVSSFRRVRVWSQHHPQTRTLSLPPHWYRRQFLAILCTLTPTVPLCASICAHAHYMPMQVDVECAELFVADLNTFLCRHGVVISNDSQSKVSVPQWTFMPMYRRSRSDVYLSRVRVNRLFRPTFFLTLTSQFPLSFCSGPSLFYPVW